ncbi:MAG: adenylate kinase family protein [Chthoniobacterales bacterium]
MKRRLVLLGAPGSGKGTQSEMITRHFGIPVTSTGTILRREMELGTLLGLEVAERTKHGELVSDKLIIDLIEDYVRLHGAHGFVFDGFPRTIPQAEALEGILHRFHVPLDLAIWLDVTAETISERISHRLQCQSCGFTTSEGAAVFSERAICPYCDGPLVRRTDDTPDVLQKRLDEFNAKTQPVGDFYARSNQLHRIDGNRDRESVFADISQLVEQAA